MATAETLESLRTMFNAQLAEAESAQALQQVKSAFFGPKGHITLLARGVGQLPPEERPTAGKEINRVRQALEGALEETIAKVEAGEREKELRKSRHDMTLPGRALHPRGAVHPVNRVM